MSRFYRVEVEVQNLNLTQAREAKKVLTRFMDIEGDLKPSHKHPQYAVWGTQTLCGGKIPNAAHEDLREALHEINKKFRVRTKWLCTDDIEWDEICADKGFKENGVYASKSEEPEKKPLFKTTIVIWTKNDATPVSLEDLSREATNGNAYCSKQTCVEVKDPNADDDWEDTEFFRE